MPDFARSDDLSARLLEAIELDAGGAQADLDDLRSLYSRRRRAEKALCLCQAHREIVEAHPSEPLDRWRICATCSPRDQYGDHCTVLVPCPTLKALAHGYGIEA